MGLFDTTWSLQAEKLMPPVLRDRQFIAKDGDFESGDPENDYIEYIVFSSPGHWKEFATIGVAIWNYLQGTQSPQVLQRNITEQLKKDIFTKPYVDVKNFPTVVINNTTFTLDGE